MELLLLRHGKSDWSVPVKDFDRPLKTRGKRGAQRIGAYLAEKQILPDYVLSSDALRARTTAEKCVKAAGMSSAAIHWQADAYEASVSRLLKLLAAVPLQARRVLLVGHNPGLEDLLLQLCQAPPPMPSDGKYLPTACLAHLKFDARVQPQQGRLLRLQRARDLPKGFAWPFPDGAQRRARPAYYYRQSGVLPYRWCQGRLQILLISSSSGRHWVLPKGIIEPGLSAQESACREAWEEAGIEGDCESRALGELKLQKWGATVPLQIFAMQVKNELPPGRWPESQRRRSWMDWRQAQLSLRSGEMAELIDRLQARDG